MFKQFNNSSRGWTIWRWLLLGALGLSLMALPRAAFADGPITPDFFSMDDGGVTLANPAFTALARATGAPYLRTAVYWSAVEPTNTTPDNYNWSLLDSYFNRAFSADVIPLAYVAENPSWAANTACGPIDTTNETLRAEFAEFVGALAARYPQIKRWGLYNESDGSRVDLHTGGCFGDTVNGDLNANGVPDYAEYAEMAGIARDAVHQANPDAQLFITVAFDDFDIPTCPPGYTCLPPSHFDYNFLPNLFGYMAQHPRSNGQPYADTLAFTYYDIYGPYWERQSSGAGSHGIQAKAAAIRKRMQDAGIAMPLLVVETGDDSQAGWIGADGQSRCLAISHVRGMASGLQLMTWWTFVDNPVKTWYYGLVDVNQNLKPSYTAYQTLFQQMNGWTYSKRWEKNESVEAYLFTLGGKKKWVAWSNRAQSDGKSPCAYPRKKARMNFRAKRLSVTDLYGNAKIIRDDHAGDLNPRPGRIRLALDGSPQYVVVNP